jgi:hypothetical protein
MPRRKDKPTIEVYKPGDPGYADVQEMYEVDKWMQAGAPDGMQMWLELQRRDRDGGETPAPDAATPSDWLTVAEVAETYRWSPKTVRADIGAGRLLASQPAPGRPYRVLRSDAEAWARARRAPSTQQPQRRTRRAASKPSGGSFRDLVRKPR